MTEPAPTEIVPVTLERPASTAIMTPEQYDSTSRMAKALAHSGSFKDIGKEDWSKALARILLGADLGMSPTQALMGIDIVKGNPQIRGVALGRMVRQSAKRPTPTGESYDYAVLDRGFKPGEEYAVVALYRRDEDGRWPMVEDDEGETFPTSVGPITIKPGKKLPAFVEAFKLDQALKRKLIKVDGAWDTQPEVMCVWRALSQIVRFEAPDVIGGVPVYTEADSFTPGVTDGAGTGEMPEWRLTDPSQRGAVEEVIAKARRLGHVGYSDEGTIRMRLNGQSPEVVAQWITDALMVLSQMRGHDPEPEPADAEVVTCGSSDPHRPVVCEREAGHDGAHMGGGQTWELWSTDAPSLTFGGETFLFPSGNETFYAIESALKGDADACDAVARDLMAMADSLEEGEASARYADMGIALHAEATARRGSDGDGGQPEIEF